MHVICCAGCGAFWLYYRKPNWAAEAACRRRRCPGGQLLQRSSTQWGDLQTLVLAHRGTRDPRTVIADWDAALAEREDLTARRARIQAAHPTWHRLKCLRKARDERRLARRLAREAADPRRKERRHEQHPRWVRLAKRARRDLRLKTDKIDHKPYTGGFRFHRHYAPEVLPVRQKGSAFTPPKLKPPKPFQPLPMAIRQEREAAAIVAAADLPVRKLPNPNIRRRVVGAVADEHGRPIGATEPV